MTIEKLFEKWFEELKQTCTYRNINLDTGYYLSFSQKEIIREIKNSINIFNEITESKVDDFKDRILSYVLDYEKEIDDLKSLLNYLLESNDLLTEKGKIGINKYINENYK